MPISATCCKPPQAWHQRLTMALIDNGFTPSSADPGLFTSTNKQGETSYVLVYVDDLLLAASSLAAIDSMKAATMADFEARDLGEAGTCLGMEITCERCKRLIRLSQQQHAEQLAATYSMENVLPRGVPLSPGTALSKTDGDALTAEVASNYMSLVASLLYLATCMRPDIAQSMGVLSKFMAGRHQLTGLQLWACCDTSQPQAATAQHMAATASASSATAMPTTLATSTRGD
jgi:Reverse transcriptase (RNA-dependent DNA polymerase)